MNKSDPEALLRSLVGINSVFPNEKEISRFVHQWLQDRGVKVETVVTSESPERINLVATFGEASKYLALYGHLDTVSADPKYRRSPWELFSNGNRLEGLGAEDMKGGVTAILCALEHCIEQNLPVKVVFGVDEEDISRGAHDLVNSGLLADVGFLIAAESGQIKDYAQPFAVGYGRKGRQAFKIQLMGKRAHAAEPEHGVNAVIDGCQLAIELSNLRLGNHPNLGSSIVSLYMVQGSTDALSVPDRCELGVSLLTVPGVKSLSFIEAVAHASEKLKSHVGITMVERDTPYGESYEIDRNHPLVKSLEADFWPKHEVTPVYSSSVADENVFANRLNIPVLTLGPVGGGAHSADEWVSKSSIIRTSDAFVEIVRRFVRM